MAGIFQNSWQPSSRRGCAIGEQQTKRTPLGSRFEADAIGEQQPKGMRNRGAADEADAIGEQI